MNVGDLTIRMAADIGDLLTGVDSVKGTLNQFSSDAGSAFKGVTDTFQDLVAALGVSISVEYFENLIEKTTEAQNHLLDLANYTGSTVEALSALQGPADMAGLSMDSLGGMLQKLSTHLAEAETGSGKAWGALQQLGFTSDDVATMLNGSPTDALIQIAQRLDDFHGNAQKAADEQDLFGRGSSTTATFVQELADTMNPLVTVTSDQATAAHAAKLAHEDLSLAMQALVNEGVASMLPQLTNITQAFTDIANKKDDVNGFFEVLSGTLTLVSGAAMAVWTVIQDIGDAVGFIAALGNIAATASSAGQMFREMGTALDEFQTDVANHKQDFQDFIAKIGDEGAAHETTKGDIDDHKASLQALATQQKGDSTQSIVAWIAQVEAQTATLQATDAEILGSQGALDYLKASLKGVSEELASDYIPSLLDAKQSHKDLTAEIDANKATEKLLTDQLSATFDQMQQNIQQIKDHTTQIQTDTDTLGMTSGQRDIYIAQIQLEAANQLDASANTKQTHDQVQALTDELAALYAQAGKTDLVDAAKNAQQQWSQYLNTINDTGQKVFVDLFEGGKKALTDLTDTLKKTLLQALYDLVAKPWVLQIAASVGTAIGAPGLANAANSALGTQQNLFGGGAGGGLTSLGGALSNLFGGLGGGISDMALSAMLSPALSGVTSALGLTTAAADTIAAASAEIGAGTAAVGASLTGLGATVLAAVPVVGWAVAAAAIAYELLAQKPGGPKQGGAFSDGIAGFNTYPGETSTANDSQVQTAAMGVLNTLATINTALGSTAYGQYRYGLSYDTDPQGTAQDRVSSELTTGAQVSYNQRDINAGRDNTSLQTEMTDQMQAAIIAGINATNLADPFKQLFNKIDTTLSSADFNAAIQQIINFRVALDAFADQGLAQRFEQAADINPAAISALTQFALAYTAVETALSVDPQAAAMQQVANANTTAYGAVLKLRDGLSSLVSTYDGSTAATNNLAAATAQYVAAQVQALVQIQQLKDSISGLFSDSIRQVTLQAMTPDQQQQFYLNEVQQSWAQLATAIDPSTINQLSTLINTDLLAAFNLLSPADQVTQQQSYIQQLNMTNTMAQTQLQKATDSITQANATQQTILTTIQDAITGAANTLLAASASLTASAASTASATDVFAQGANTIASAGDTFKAAADEGVQVAVSFTADTPGSAQVNFPGSGQGGG